MIAKDMLTLAFAVMAEVIFALWSRGNYSVLSANRNHKRIDC